MKKYLYIFVFLFSCLTSSAQDDLFGSFTTGNSTSSSVSPKSAPPSSVSNNRTTNKRTSQQDRSQLASNNTQKKAPNGHINKKIKSKKTEPREGGGTIEYTYYEDGDYRIYTKGPCNFCKGNGDCYNCHGKGSIEAIMVKSKCLACNGAGHCKHCAGTGREETEIYTTSVGFGTCTNHATGEVTYLHGGGGAYTGTNNTNTYSSGSSSRSSSSGSSRIKCNNCNGSGVCNYCHGKCGEYRWIYDSKQWMDCPSCDGRGRCRICYGRGYIH